MPFLCDLEKNCPEHWPRESMPGHCQWAKYHGPLASSPARITPSSLDSQPACILLLIFVRALWLEGSLDGAGKLLVTTQELLDLAGEHLAVECGL